MRNTMAICNPIATTMVPHRTQFLLLAALLIPTIVCAADFTDPVVSIRDGDTLEVLHNQHPEHIRLSDIDCPDKGWAYGTQAIQAASVQFMARKSPSRPKVTISTSPQATHGLPNHLVRDLVSSTPPTCWMSSTLKDRERYGRLFQTFLNSPAMKA